MTTMTMRVPERDQRKGVPAKPGLLVVPAVLLIVVAFGLPMVEVLTRSVTDPRLGMQNYIWMLTNETVVVVALRTFGMALLVSAICILLAYPYAYLMTISSDSARRWLMLLVLLPLYSSILIRTLAWFVLLQDTGPINDVLEVIGIGRIPLIRTTFGVALGMTQILLPFVVLPLYSSMEKVSPGLLPAARSLGATPIRAFFSIYLPLTRPGLIAGGTSVFILALGFFIIPSMLGSPSNTFLPSLIYQQINGFLLWGQGTALGIGLLVATLVLLVLGTRLARARRTVGQGRGRQ